MAYKPSKTERRPITLQKEMWAEIVKAAEEGKRTVSKEIELRLETLTKLQK
jgi:hypothetical protein